MKKNLLFVINLLFLPNFLFAHGLQSNALLSGLSHPILGIDHLLAILGLGILSSQLDGKSIWSIPIAFSSSMLIAGTLGIGQEGFPYMEFGIALSVLVFGVSILIKDKLPDFFILILAPFFGFFHGFAHGVEMPVDTNPIIYISGYILGVILIFLLGILIGKFGQKSEKNKSFIKVIGGLLALMGLYILVS